MTHLSQKSDAYDTSERALTRHTGSRRARRMAKVAGLVGVAAVTAIVVRFFPDLRRYVRIKRM